MADTIDIAITSTFSPAGTQQASAALAKLESAQAQLARAQTAGATGSKEQAAAIEKATAAVQKAERGVLAEAQALARLQQASGNAAQAEQTLAAALEKVDRSTIQAINAQTQLVNVQNRLSNAKGPTVLPRTIDGLSGAAQQAAANVQQAVVAVGALSGALAAAKASYDLAETAAKANLVRQRFDGLAQSAGTTGQALMTALRAASGGEINDLNLRLAANRAQLLGVAHSAEEFGVLMAIARDRAQQMGTSTTQAFNDLVTGLGRGSAPILDNLGIIVSADEANKAYAASIGKTANQLSEAEKKQALINQVIADGKRAIDATGGAAETQAASFDRLQASADNFKIALGGIAATRIAPLADDITKVMNALQGAGSVREGARGILDLGGTIVPQIDILKGMISTIDSAGAAVARFAGIQVPDHFSALQSSLDAWGRLLGVVPPATAATETNTQATATNSSAISYQSQAMIDFAAAQMEGTQAVADFTSKVQENAAQALIAQAQTQLLRDTQSELEIAARGAAAGSADLGTAAAALAAQFNLPIAKAYELIALLRQVGVLQSKGGIAAGVGARVEVPISRGRGMVSRGDDTAAIGARSTALAQQATQAAKARDAEIGLAQAQGNNARAIALLREQQQGLNTTDAAFIAIEQRITTLSKSRGGGGGGGARASAASASGTKLAEIERDTGQKLAAIDQETQQKLLDIDEKYAARRAEAQRKLAEAITTSTDDLVAAQEADDLDLIGTKEEDAARLAAREQAQAQARIRNEQAVAEARQMAASGDAETAQQVLEIRQRAIEQQQQLDQRYAERQAELAGNPEALAALQQQYDEASAAIKQGEDDRVGIAMAAADQRKAAQQAERDAAVAAAQEQKDKIVAAAVDQMDRVKGAADAQKQAVFQALDAQAHAAGNWASATEAAAGRVIAAAESAGRAIQSMPSAPSGGGGSDAAAPPIAGRAAGGGTFETRGPALLLVGDNPGGRERVAVTPLSGRGQTRIMGGGALAMAGGGTVEAGGDAGSTLSRAAGLLRIAQAAAADAKVNADALKTYADATSAGVTILTNTAKLASMLQGRRLPGIAPAYVQALAEQSKMVAHAMAATVVPQSEDQAKQAAAYYDQTGKVIDTLTSVLTLTATLQGRPPAAIPAGYVERLVAEAQAVGRIVGGSLLPVSVADAAMAEDYAAAVKHNLDILTDTSDLASKLAEPAPPISAEAVARLAREAQAVGRIVGGTLVPVSEADAQMSEDYAKAVKDNLSILSDTMELRDKLKAAQPPINEALVRRLAQEAQRVGRIVGGSLIPVSEADARMSSAYAKAVGENVSIIKDALALNSQMFAEFRPPSDAQIGAVVASVRRVAVGVAKAARGMGTEGIAAAKAFNDATGGMFGTLKDALVFFQAVESGDFVPKAANLAAFERATTDTLTIVRRLGAIAATIPAGDLTALNAATSAVGSASEALIKLAAVPFGNLPSAVAGLGGAGGALLGRGGGGETVINVIVNNPPATLDVPSLVRQVVPAVRTALGRDVQARR